MSWSATLSSDLPIIETRYVGVMTPSELSDAVQETLRLVQTSGRTLLVGDCSQLVGGHSITDLYRLAASLEASGMVNKLKEAVLLPSVPEANETAEFWETVSHNRGMDVRLFSDRQSALAWLFE